jgi:hypothetical protein
MLFHQENNDILSYSSDNNMSYQYPEETPIYNFEHEDITYTAFINEEMINSMLSVAIQFAPKIGQLVQIVKTLSTLYGIWYIYQLLKIPEIMNGVWKTLTPGQQYTELAYIASGLLVVIGFAITATSITNRMNAHLARLNNERDELKTHIEELEKENEEMKITFKTMMSYANPNVMLRKRVKQLKN